MTDTLPNFADTVVVGGGTAGAAIAAELAARSNQSVLLLEAGPDYGSCAGGRWPAELCDARAIPTSHDWGYNSGADYGQRVIKFDRARVIGGCSAHNGCVAIWGSRLDYDNWQELGNAGWSTDDLLQFFHSATDRLRVRIPPRDEVTPYQLAWLDAAPSAGIPHVADLNDLDENVGMAPSPANISRGVRWNTSFAYLDVVRGRANLTIAGNVLADRLEIQAGRVESIRVIRDGRVSAVRAGRVVLAAGTYGSPAILLRSGVGNAPDVRALGIAPVVDLAGVGRNLHDHPVVNVEFSGTPQIETAMRDFGARRWMPEEQTLAKARSPRCGPRGFDLHLYPVGGPLPTSPGAWFWIMVVACMTPRSRGTLKLASVDPTHAPRIDHAYLSDHEGEDLRVLVEGVRLVRQISSEPPLAAILGREKWPGRDVNTIDQLAQQVRANFMHYYHPVGTCSMGPTPDAGAVVDSRGRVHGLDNCYVADASIMPVIPRANTNIPALVIALRIASWLLDA